MTAVRPATGLRIDAARIGYAALGAAVLLGTACSGPAPMREPTVIEGASSAPVEGRVAPTTSPRQAPQAPPAASAPAAQAPASAAPPPQAGAAAIALLEQARAEAAAGAGERAAALLERALRIEPENPWLWHRLAVLRLQQGLWAQAEDLAARSIALAGGHRRLLGGNWRVIARARAGSGDVAGAREAEALARTYFDASAHPGAAAPDP